MTDPTPTPPVPPTPDEPVTPPAAAVPAAATVPPAAPIPPAAPVPPAPPAYASAPGVAAPKRTLSLVSFILGLAAFVFSWTGILGIAAGIAAIILSRRAKKSEPGAPSWMGLIGLIAGIIGIVLGAIIGLVTILTLILSAVAANSYGNY